MCGAAERRDAEDLVPSKAIVEDSDGTIGALAPCQPGHVSPTRTPPSGKGPPISGLKIAVAGGEDDSPDGKMSTPKWARELVGSAELS